MGSARPAGGSDYDSSGAGVHGAVFRVLEAAWSVLVNGGGAVLGGVRSSIPVQVVGGSNKHFVFVVVRPVEKSLMPHSYAAPALHVHSGLLWWYFDVEIRKMQMVGSCIVYI